jgi:hypothetical protein
MNAQRLQRVISASHHNATWLNQSHNRYLDASKTLTRLIDQAENLWVSESAKAYVAQGRLVVRNADVATESLGSAHVAVQNLVSIASELQTQLLGAERRLNIAQSAIARLKELLNARDPSAELYDDVTQSELDQQMLDERHASRDIRRIEQDWESACRSANASVKAALVSLEAVNSCVALDFNNTALRQNVPIVAMSSPSAIRRPWEVISRSVGQLGSAVLNVNTSKAAFEAVAFLGRSLNYGLKLRSVEKQLAESQRVMARLNRWPRRVVLRRIPVIGMIEKARVSSTQARISNLSSEAYQLRRKLGIASDLRGTSQWRSVADQARVSRPGRMLASATSSGTGRFLARRVLPAASIGFSVMDARSRFSEGDSLGGSIALVNAAGSILMMTPLAPVGAAFVLAATFTQFVLSDSGQQAAAWVGERI